MDKFSRSQVVIQVRKCPGLLAGNEGHEGNEGKPDRSFILSGRFLIDALPLSPMP